MEGELIYIYSKDTMNSYICVNGGRWRWFKTSKKMFPMLLRELNEDQQTTTL